MNKTALGFVTGVGSFHMGGLLRAELLGHIRYGFVAPMDGWMDCGLLTVFEGCSPYNSLHTYRAGSLTGVDAHAPTNVSTSPRVSCLSRTTRHPLQATLVWSRHRTVCPARFGLPQHVFSVWLFGLPSSGTSILRCIRVVAPVGVAHSFLLLSRIPQDGHTATLMGVCS